MDSAIDLGNPVTGYASSWARPSPTGLPREVLPMNLLQPATLHMGIDLSRGEIGMT